MQDPPTYDRDLEHLKLLKLFHYIMGALTCALSSLSILHFIMGLLLVLNPGVLTMPDEQGPQVPPGIGYVFMVMAAIPIVIGWSIGFLLIYSGRQMAKLRRRTLSIIVAGLGLLAFPFGTILGIFTLIVLFRESVAQRYLDQAVASNALDPPTQAADHF